MLAGHGTFNNLHVNINKTYYIDMNYPPQARVLVSLAHELEHIFVYLLLDLLQDKRKLYKRYNVTEDATDATSTHR